MTEHYPGRIRVGESMTDPGRRECWVSLVDEMVRLHRGPLSGYAFHGTTAAVADLVEELGVTTTRVWAFDEDVRTAMEGTYWATPAIAAFYAEDRIESEDDPDLDLAFIVVSLDDLATQGDFMQDEGSLESPIVTRLGRSHEDILAAYEALSGKECDPWKASLETTGSFVCLGEVEPSIVHVVRNANDLTTMLANLPGSPAP
jgi:hypothetical protein